MLWPQRIQQSTHSQTSSASTALQVSAHRGSTVCSSNVIIDPSHSQCSVNYTFSQTRYLQLSYTASQYKSTLFAKQGSAEHSNDDCTQIKQVGVVKYGLQTQESFFLPHAAVISLFSFPSSSPSAFCSPCSPFALASRVQATLRFAPIKTSPSPPPQSSAWPPVWPSRHESDTDEPWQRGSLCWHWGHSLCS